MTNDINEAEMSEELKEVLKETDELSEEIDRYNIALIQATHQVVRKHTMIFMYIVLSVFMILMTFIVCSDDPIPEKIIFWLVMEVFNIILVGPIYLACKFREKQDIKKYKKDKND